MPNDKVSLPPISEQLHEAIDRECQGAYGRGAEAVWHSLGVGVGDEFPNDAEWNEATSVYVVRPKTACRAA